MRWICRACVLLLIATACAKPKPKECVPRKTFPASGFFHVEEDCGYPLLVDSHGAPFFSFGVNHVRWDGDPSPTTNTNPYAMAVLARYGTETDWAQATAQRLQTWGWNTIGAWSSDSVSALMPYTIILSLSGADWSTGKVPDYFDPAWAATVEMSAASGASSHADDHLLVGYFIDNEMHWGPDWRTGHELLDDFAELPPMAPGKQALVNLLSMNHHGDIADFNRAWGTDFASFDAVAAATSFPARGVSASATADRSAFITLASRRFFSVTSGAIRAADPNHLVLGVRFVAAFVPVEAAAAAGAFCDVITVNDYEFVIDPQTIYPPDQYGMVLRNTPRALEDFYVVSGRPVMVTEFGYRAVDSGLPNTWPPVYPTFATQSDRADQFSAFADGLLSAPWVVGYHWFEYADEPPGGRFDGENSNWGLVSTSDDPYTVVTTRTAAVNHWTPH